MASKPSGKWNPIAATSQCTLNFGQLCTNAEKNKVKLSFKLHTAIKTTKAIVAPQIKIAASSNESIFPDTVQGNNAGSVIRNEHKNTLVKKGFGLTRQSESRLASQQETKSSVSEEALNEALLACSSQQTSKYTSLKDVKSRLQQFVSNTKEPQNEVELLSLETKSSVSKESSRESLLNPCSMPSLSKFSSVKNDPNHVPTKKQLCTNEEKNKVKVSFKLCKAAKPVVAPHARIAASSIVSISADAIQGNNRLITVSSSDTVKGNESKNTLGKKEFVSTPPTESGLVAKLETKSSTSEESSGDLFLPNSRLLPLSNKFSSVNDESEHASTKKLVNVMSTVCEEILESSAVTGESGNRKKRLISSLADLSDNPAKRCKATGEEENYLIKNAVASCFRANVRFTSRSRINLPEFVILRFSSCKTMVSRAVLEASARFCNTELQYIERRVNPKKFSCNINLAGQAMVFKNKTFESNSEIARDTACGKVLSRLRNFCCSIVIKEQRMVTNEQWSNYHTITKLCEDAARAKASKNSTDLKNKFDKVVLYLGSFQPEEDLLVFTGLSEDVRIIITDVAKNVGYLAASSDFQTRPYTVLSRHQSVNKLIDCIRAKGGETSNYSLTERFIPAKFAEQTDKDVILKLATSGSVMKFDIVDKKPDSVDRKPLGLVQGRLYDVTAVASLPSSSCSSTQNKISTSSCDKIECKTSPDEPSVVSPVEHVSSLQFVPLTDNRLLNVSYWLTMDEILLKKSVKPFVKSNPQGLELSGDPLRFVIVRMQSCSGFVLSPLAVLDVSVELCDCTIVYHCSSVADGIKCCINLNGVMVGQAVGDNAFRAKMSAAHESLCYLSTFCPTIIAMDPLKQQLSSFKDVIALEQLQRQFEQSSHAWHDLLRDSFNAIFEKYFEVPHSQDLFFTPAVASQERSMLIAMAEKRGIQVYRCSDSISFFCIILARLRDPFEIVQHIRANSGKTLRYRLFEPPRPA